MSDPHIPNDLPDLRRVGRIAIDSEERDNGLAADRGSSWPWHDGHVCGISVAYRADGQVRGHYFPMRHPDTQNFPPEQVYAWLKDHIAAGLSFVAHNGPFDWGWFRTEAGIHVPSGERLEELGALATLTNENRHGYGLDTLARSCGLPGKDERLLKEGCLALDLIANKRKKFRPQNYLWQLPAKYVAPYAVADAINTLLTYELFDPILDQENTRAAYRLECNLVPLIIEMQLRGIRIDISAAERARDFLLGKRDAALNQLSDKLGMPVSMDELNQNDWKVEICDREGVAYPRTEKGNPSFAKDWTEGHPHWLPQLIREAGKYHRVGDLFVDKFILGHMVNGRIHAEIHPQNRGPRCEVVSVLVFRPAIATDDSARRRACTDHPRPVLTGRRRDMGQAGCIAAGIPHCRALCGASQHARCGARATALSRRSGYRFSSFCGTDGWY